MGKIVFNITRAGRDLNCMNQYYKIAKVVVLYLISPASYLVSKFNIDNENAMLFRMTINICYYTAIIIVYFIITNI